MTQKQEITDLGDLIHLLDKCSKEEYKELGRQIVIPKEDFEEYQFYSEEHYTRNCIKRTDDYELILLCWEEGQETPIHCHNDQECWVHIVKGEFKEKRYEEKKGNLILDHEMTLGEKRVSYMNDDMGYHSLENSHDGRSISLHLYMDPIEECKIYNEDKGDFEVVELEYYSYSGVLEEST